MPSQLDDLEAMIRELEAQLQTAPPEMHALLRQQIESTKSTVELYRRAEPAIEQNKQHRMPVAPHMVAFFTPEPPAEVPAWIPDQMMRGHITEEWLRCPPESQVFWRDTGVGCAISVGPGRIPIPHGINVSFYASTGSLQSQQLYERGCVRWSIEYHPLGGRASVGFYVGTEPKTYPRQGLHTFFAPNGTIVSQSWHEAGTPHGWQKLWETDGLPIVATLYEQGRAVESVLPDGSRRPG